MNRDPFLWALSGLALLAGLLSVWAGSSITFALPFAAVAAVPALVVLVLALTGSGLGAPSPHRTKDAVPRVPLREAMTGDRSGVFDALHSLERSAGRSLGPGDREEEARLLRAPHSEFLDHVERRIEQLERST
ncbi:MAG: hypothetical protein L3K03_02330 [Thermoplasmata archaeon]|nr:hypothetical protein [Thermoplasmata archaeon]